MGILNFGKKNQKKEEKPSVNFNSVKVLGAGCKACHKQYENVKASMKKMGVSVEVEYITDMEKVMTYGAMSMPVIVVNEKIVSEGVVLKASEVEKLFRKLEN